MLANFVSAQNSAENNSSSAVVGAPAHSTTEGGIGCGQGDDNFNRDRRPGGGTVGAGGSRLVVQSVRTVGDEESNNINNNSNANKEHENNSSEAKHSLSPFSMPGVLHFLQQEWGRYELDRAQWEIERSEIKARISFLIGERKSQENLKHDLVRRIKMLEYALKQERAKSQHLLDNQATRLRTAATNLDDDDDGEQIQDGDGTQPNNATKSSVPFDIDAILPPSPPSQQQLSSATSSHTSCNNHAVGGGTVPPPSGATSDQAWAHARETLRNYLQEIGYTEHMLEARCYRVKQLLDVNGCGVADGNDAQQKRRGGVGTSPSAEKCTNGGGAGKLSASVEKALLESEQAILEAADAIVNKSSVWKKKKSASGRYTVSSKCGEESDCSSSDDQPDIASGDVGAVATTAELDAETVNAFSEFAFLKNETTQQQSKQVEGGGSINEMKKRYKEDSDRRRQQSRDSMAVAIAAQQRYIQQERLLKQQQQLITVDTVHDVPPATVAASADQQQQQPKNILLTDSGDYDGDDEKYADIKSGFEDDEDDTVQQLRWNIRATLRSHYDSVRAMQFHPVEPVLITASEDGTAKLWDLHHSSIGGGAAKNEGAAGSVVARTAQSTTGIVDIEPLYTFRGHRGPILTLDLAPLGETLYTGGLDGTICSWTVPQTVGLDIYHTFDPSVLQERLCGHTDAVWSLCFHASSNRLISASADGTIRIWIVGLADGAMPSPLLKTIQVSANNELINISNNIRPHSIDLVSTADRQQLLCAYHDAGNGGSGCCNIRDLETGQVVVNFQFGGGDDQPSALNKILSHPTMPVSIAAGEDRKIRFFDNNTGKQISATMAHVEGVSTLAIDPNGLYMLSGSHDGSLRLWNAEKRVCIQEIAAHRKKFGAGVMAVAFHPSRQLIGSSGADSLAKVYSPTRQSPRSSVVAAYGSSPSSSPGSSGPSSVIGSPQKASPTYAMTASKQQSQQHNNMKI